MLVWAGATSERVPRLLAGVVNDGRRGVFELREGRWTHAARPMRFRGLPNQNSAPWADADRVLFARSELLRAEVPLFIDRARRGKRLTRARKPLDRVPDSLAQGRLFDLRGRPWIIWQEMTRDGDRDRTVVYAAPLSRRGEPGRVTRVGEPYRSAAPAMLNLVHLRSGPHAIVARSRPRSGRRVVTRVTVEPVRP